jgi:uncharacterized membrane protein YidH (DUF202 family)
LGVQFVFAGVVAVVGLMAVALNFYTCAQAERRHLRFYTPHQHWQSEVAIDLVAGVVIAIAAVIVIASLLH